jgi:hypothetical protein
MAKERMRRTSSLLSCSILLFGFACGGGDERPKAEDEPSEPFRFEVLATDFAFQLETDSVPAGEVETFLTNEGKDPHQAIFYILHSDTTQEEFVEAALKHQERIPQITDTEVEGVMTGVSPGDTDSHSGDVLEPGNYAMACFLRNVKRGKDHAALGMVAFFTVK